LLRTRGIACSPDQQAEFAAAAVLSDKATLAVLRGQRQRRAEVQVRGSQRAYTAIRRWLVQEERALKRGSVQAPDAAGRRPHLAQEQGAA